MFARRSSLRSVSAPVHATVGFPGSLAGHPMPRSDASDHSGSAPRRTRMWTTWVACASLAVGASALATPSFASSTITSTSSSSSVDAALDRVVTKDGKAFEGRVVFENTKRVVLRVGSKDREFPADAVAEVRSVARSVREVVARWAKLAPDDAAGRMDLAQLAKGRDLAGEAATLAWSVLAVDPANEAAHSFLRHEKKGDRWLVQEGVRAWPYDKYVEQRGDFSDAWRLSTTHFDVRTNLPLGTACDAMLELEQAYVQFYAWFAPQVELYEIDEPVRMQLHADRKSYPGGSGRKAYFDPASNTVFADMSESFEIGLLIHETTRALFHATSVRTKDARGTIPAWLEAGMADYAAGCRSGPLGRPEYTPGVAVRSLCGLHATATKPYGLSRILSLVTDDFVLSTNPAGYYAQSYTLVHFALHGDDGKYRLGFLEFVKSCYAGHSSATDFKSTMAIQERAFEAAWLAHAKRNS